MPTFSFWGAVALISSTAIGAGMLTLPVATAPAGLFPTLTVFVLMAFFMMRSGFWIVDLCAYFPEKKDLISMAYASLGSRLGAVAHFFYFGLLYALCIAYTAGFVAIFERVISPQIFFGPWIVAIILTMITALAAAAGAEKVDRWNRPLVFLMLVSFFLLSYGLSLRPRLYDFTNQWSYAYKTLPWVAASFGFHILIPSIYHYLGRSRSLTQSAVFLGCLFPLIIYIVWQVLAALSLPQYFWLEAYANGQSASHILIHHTSGITRLAIHLFEFTALWTSFLGVTLSLYDSLRGFLASHFSARQAERYAYWLLIGPILFFALTSSGLFISALGWAGFTCALLLGFFPLLMWAVCHRFNWINVVDLTSAGMWYALLFLSQAWWT